MVKKLALALLLLCGVTLLCRLGFWQLSRAKEKESILLQIEEAKTKPPLTQTTLSTLQPNANLRFAPVSFKAYVDNQHAIMLDNKTHQGQAGYHVLVPLLMNDNQVILLNRGWIPLGQSRAQLPAIAPIIGEVTIEGSLDFAYRNSLISQPLESQIISWPLRMQQLDWDLMSHLLGKKIIPMVINLKATSPLAFIQVPKEKEMISTERHLGYAVQWFALAATLFFFSGFYFCKRSNR